MNKILNDLKTILWFFLFPVFVLIVHVLLLFVFEVYLIFPWLDIPMHFLGGASIALTYFLTLKFLQKENYFKLNAFFNIFFIFALVSLTAVLWEFLEFSLTYITGFSLQGNLSDTMLDLFLGMLGGLLTAIILERIK